MTQRERYERFKALHERPGAFVMPNAWDALSALLCKAAGFEALGTSSAAIAFSLGRLDGAHAVSREEHLANAALIGTASGLPVNGDTEDGFGPAPSDAVATVEAAIAAGPRGRGDRGYDRRSGRADSRLRRGRRARASGRPRPRAAASS